MLYDKDTWLEWSSRIENGFRRKSYIHFDHPVNFPEQKQDIESLFRIPGKISRHSFSPLIKTVLKTPRFKIDDTTGDYVLTTKERPISYASHLDTYIYGFYSYALTKRYQSYIKNRGFNECVLAYRTDLEGKCNIQFAKEAFDIIKSKGRCTAIALDIKGYFDSIDHTILRQKWAQVLEKELLDDDEYAIFKSLTRYAYVNQETLLRHFGIKIHDKGLKKPSSYSVLLPGQTLSQKLNNLRKDKLVVFNRTHATSNNNFKRFYGIPQGSALSATLSNIYLIDFDEYMLKLGQEKGFTYRRYCDDILIVCESVDALKIKEETIKEISHKYFLEIQPSKIEIIQYDTNSKGQIRGFNLEKIIKDNISAVDSSNEQRYYKALQYLGFEFTGQKVLIRSSSLSRYFRKMRARIVKSISMAYGKSGVSDRIFKQQIFKRYTHLGKQNFLRYAYNASLKQYSVKRGKKEGFDSPAIRSQLSRHFSIVIKSLQNKNEKRLRYKRSKNKNIKMKKI